jgi:putative flippase GtrA
VTSLIFVSASGLLFLISKEVSLTNSVLLGVFATIINLVRAKILFGILFLPFALAAGVVTALIFRFIWHPAEEG